VLLKETIQSLQPKKGWLLSSSFAVGHFSWCILSYSFFFFQVVSWGLFVSVSFLNFSPSLSPPPFFVSCLGGIYVDGTFGSGGHSTALLST